MNFQNVLVTGGCGFIASNFLNMMVPKYRHVNWINIDALYYCADMDNVTESVRNSRNYTFIKGNTNSMDLILHVLNEFNIDCIINFAAQSHVCNSFGEPLLYTKDNIMGTHTLIESCRQYGIDKFKKFIHVSTDEVYGESDLNGDCKDEGTILFPTNPYSATKAAAEMIAISYYKSFGLPLVISRGNNVYGPRQYPEKLIPKFITLLMNNQKCTIHGEGNQLRSFLYVDDTARAFETLMLKGEIGEIYNIGCRNEYSVMDITKILLKEIKPNCDLDDWIEYVEDRDFNDVRYHISIDKLAKLGWKPEVDFMEGMHRTIQYCLNKYKKTDNILTKN
jgi:UDP-glucose 4,6-dehydratase